MFWIILIAGLSGMHTESLAEHLAQMDKSLSKSNADQIENKIAEIRGIAAERGAWKLWERSMLVQTRAQFLGRPYGHLEAFEQLLRTRPKLRMACSIPGFQAALERSRAYVNTLPRGKLTLVSNQKMNVMIDGVTRGKLEGSRTLYLPYGRYWLTFALVRNAKEQKTIGVEVKDANSELDLDWPNLARQPTPTPVTMTNKTKIKNKNEQNNNFYLGGEIAARPTRWYKSPWIYSIGGVFAATGVLFLAYGGYHRAQLNDAVTMTRNDIDRHIDAYELYEPIGGISLGIGVAMIGTSLLWYLFSDDQPPNHQLLGSMENNSTWRIHPSVLEVRF